MKINDTLSGAAIAALGIVILVHVQSFPPMPGQKVGPAMFPGLLAVGLLICAAGVIWRGLKTLKSEGWLVWPEWLAQRRIAAGFCLIPVVLVVYTLISEKLGFIPTGIAFLFSLCWVFRVRPWVAFAVAVAGTLVIHTIFYKLLKVPLPWGIMSGMVW
jgi:putative tricarboxylic transport membrane protein